MKRKKENTKRRLPNWLPQWLDTPLRFLFKTAIALAIVIFSIACYFWHQATKFDIAKVSEMPGRTIILDINGEEFASLGGQRRRLITYEEIPEHLKAALFAREDVDFESHWGVKWKGLMRAAVRNIQDGQYTQGGSTLSMQLIKNTYNYRKKSIPRKLLEIALTYRLENHYGKTEILTHYLNRIYFGAGCYGVEEAAQTYFGKATKDLHEGESAMLAGIIRGPELFSPTRHFNRALKQRDQVIERMLAVGAIDQAQANKIKLKPITMVKHTKLKTPSQSYVLQMVERHLKQVFSEEELNLGGLIVHTTIDTAQVARISKLHQQIPHDQSHPLQSAGIVMDANTGAILALNGGYDPIKSPFNIALDGRRTLRAAYTPLLFLGAVHLGEDPIKNEAVQTGRLIDRKKLIRFSKKLELGERLSESEDLFRGEILTSPLRLATAYSVYATDGSVPHTYILDSVSNTHGEILYEHPSKKEQITAEGNVEIAKSFFPSETKDGWTYTAIDPKLIDGWCVNIKGSIVTLLWCGYAENKSMRASESDIRSGFLKIISK